MKRTAAQAFAPPAIPVFQPDSAALLDPKAYFAQWTQQAVTLGQAPVPAALVPPVVAASASATAPFAGEKSEIMKEVEQASAVRCAAIVKEKGANFTASVAIAALNTMATKSSFELRQELSRQPPVKKLIDRVKSIINNPPASMPMESLARAAWSLTRFPEDVRGDVQKTFGATARVLASLPSSGWTADSAAKVLWSLAKGEAISDHKQLVSQVVQELVRDQGRRVAELSHEGLVNLLWAVARSRRHVRQGDHQTVHAEANDELLFEIAAKRVAAEIDYIDVRHLADLIHTHAEIGIRDEALFKAICPKIVAKQKDLNEKAMAKVIKAYARFMIPLKEEAQGFRTMAVVQKGDFIRPSEKPRHQGKRTYDHPVALYPKTPLHGK